MNTTAQGATALVFQSTTFDIVDRSAQPWLRSPQLADALGYAQANRINDLYTRNASEFTDSMTALVKLPTAGGEQETRIFSLRGAHLLGMFARTDKAREFRRWVLDILDHETAPALPQYITQEQCGEINALIAERFPEGRDRPYAWGRFANHFRLSSGKSREPAYKFLSFARFEEACEYIKTMPGKNEPPAPTPKSLPDVTVLFAGARFLTTLGCDGRYNTVSIAPEAHVFTLQEFEELLKRAGKVIVPIEAVRAFQNLLK